MNVNYIFPVICYINSNAPRLFHYTLLPFVFVCQRGGDVKAIDGSVRLLIPFEYEIHININIEHIRCEWMHKY